MTSTHSTRKTSIRTRKIRGEDSLLSSISIAEREEGPGGIAGVIRCEGPRAGLNMAQRSREKSLCGAGKGNFGVKPGLDMRTGRQPLPDEGGIMTVVMPAKAGIQYSVTP